MVRRARGSRVRAGRLARPWRDLDGLRWTPWGTLLFAEEDPQGHVFEIVLDPRDPSTAVALYDRPAVGLIRHEGIEVGSDGAVYVIDELNGGSIFRFVPDRYGDLSAGQLYALRLTGISDAASSWNSGDDHTVLGHTMSFLEEIVLVGVLAVAFSSAAVWRFRRAE